jgi:hypothetical protein
LPLEDEYDAFLDSARHGYIDEDGEATEHSVFEFEKAEKWQAWSIAALSALGFAVSLAQAVVVTCAGDRGRHFMAISWVGMVGWVSFPLDLGWSAEERKRG